MNNQLQTTEPTAADSEQLADRVQKMIEAGDIEAAEQLSAAERIPDADWQAAVAGLLEY